METTWATGDCKLFQMMPYVIILKVIKFHQPTANRFSTARKKPVEGHNDMGFFLTVSHES